MCDQTPDHLLPVGDQDLPQMGVELVKIFRSLEPLDRLTLLNAARALRDGGSNGQNSRERDGRPFKPT